MIVSHRHGFVFFAVPRTATHAVRAALADTLDAGDWRQEALTERVVLPVPTLARLGHGHISLRQAIAYLPASVCRDYFKFAFVRHPFDRFVSVCAMLNRRDPRYPGRERAFMQGAINRPRFRARVLVRPQVAMLTTPAGNLGMDYVGRFETLQQSFDEVCDRIGVGRRHLDIRNAATHGDYRDIFDAELERSVAAFYREDFAMLDYEAPACV